jgi:hypothetical protein
MSSSKEKGEYNMRNSIESKFRKFHKEHPEVYRDILHLAIQSQLLGRKKIGMKSLYEKIRWDYMLNPKYEHVDFELNNNFTSRYARLIMKDVPYLRGLFETRDLKRA